MESFVMSKKVVLATRALARLQKKKEAVQ